MNVKMAFDSMVAVFAGLGIGYSTGMRNRAKPLQVAASSDLVSSILFIEPFNLKHGLEIIK